jgi:hypothetical protein
MTDSDKAALDLAMVRASELEPGRGEQLDSKLAEEGWEATAKFAAAYCQSRTLNLQPWEISPAQIDDPYDRIDLFLRDPFGYAGYFVAARLLRRMLQLGVSKWRPDPVAAIEEAKQRKAV